MSTKTPAKQGKGGGRAASPAAACPATSYMKKTRPSGFFALPEDTNDTQQANQPVNLNAGAILERGIRLVWCPSDIVRVGFFLVCFSCSSSAPRTKQQQQPTSFCVKDPPPCSKGDETGASQPSEVVRELSGILYSYPRFLIFRFLELLTKRVKLIP